VEGINASNTSSQRERIVHALIHSLALFEVVLLGPNGLAKGHIHHSLGHRPRKY
jgi:hypothetical protein